MQDSDRAAAWVGPPRQALLVVQPRFPVCDVRQEGLGVTGRKAMALLGFVVLGLSPSFVDWQQSPEQRTRIVAFYVVGLALVYYGALAG